MIDIQTVNCGLCNWWVPASDGSVEPDMLGKCQRFPPMPFKGGKGHDLIELAVSCTFPVTYKHLFCGEFKAK